MHGVVSRPAHLVIQRTEFAVIFRPLGWKVRSQRRDGRQTGKHGPIASKTADVFAQLLTNQFNYAKYRVESFPVGQSDRPGRSKLVTKEAILRWFHGGLSDVDLSH